MAQNISVI